MDNRRNTVPTVLILTADTGGGHRAAADAIAEELARRYPTSVTTLVCDPLTGPLAPRVVRWACRLYGPLTRRAPLMWAAAFHLTNNRPVAALLGRLVERIARAGIGRHRPAAVVAVHPLAVPLAATTPASGSRAVRATVVTDLATAHRTWWDSRMDLVVAPEQLRTTGRRDAVPHRTHRLGVPVGRRFQTHAIRDSQRRRLRRSLGIAPTRFTVLLTAGGEGARGLKQWARAILDGVAGVDVVVVCGRNRRLRAELTVLSRRMHGRLTVTGFVDNMADWLRSADVLVTKAGPGTIAEATSLGVPLLLAGHLPGQEAGNTEAVVAAGAGIAVRGPRDLVRHVVRLQQDDLPLRRMRSASARFGRPYAAARIADLIATGIDVPPHPVPVRPARDHSPPGRQHPPVPRERTPNESPAHA